jgi:hypothetical protein
LPGESFGGQHKHPRWAAFWKTIKRVHEGPPCNPVDIYRDPKIGLSKKTVNHNLSLGVYIGIFKQLEDGKYAWIDYEPSTREIPVSKPKHGASTITRLIRILKDENLPDNIKVPSARRLKDCCSWEGEIEGGKDELRPFFIEALDDLEPNKREEYIPIATALEYYIAFQLKDEEDLLWMTKSCFPKLISKFKKGVNIDERKQVLKILSRIYEVNELDKKQTELKELLRKKFFNTNEDEGIARDCWDIIWLHADGEERDTLINELLKLSKSEDEKLKERGQKQLENIVGEARYIDSKKFQKLDASIAR